MIGSKKNVAIGMSAIVLALLIGFGTAKIFPAPGSGFTQIDGATTKEHADEASENHGPEGLIELDEARIKAAGIGTETVAAGGLNAEIISQGVVAATPNGESVLTARADGAITRINRRLGDFVRAGEVIAVMESSQASAIASERSAARAKLALAQSTYAREKYLYDAKVSAKQDLEAAKAVLDIAQAELNRTQAASAVSKMSSDGRSLGVVSLISGRIAKSDAKLGSYVLAGSELFRVIDPERIQINAAVSAHDAGRVKPGDRATVELFDGRAISATVRSSTAGLDTQSKAVTIVLIPSDLTDLTSGQGVRVRITSTRDIDSSRITLPEEAVQTIDGRDVVFIRTARGFQAVNVVTGLRSAGRVEIVEGPKAGSVVATFNAFALKAELGKAEAEH